MKVPLLDLRPQIAPLEDEIKEAVNEVIGSTQYILGPKAEAFERELAGYVGARHAIGVSSGTDALLMALMALDIGPGDLVLTTPYTFFATAGVVARLRADPVFVDIDPGTYNISVEALRAWFAANPEKIARVKAILPVHLFGQCADMGPLLALASEHGIPVIEDAAQAIGARYPGPEGSRMAGTLGLMGCYSFFPSKNLGCLGDAGAVVTEDDALAVKLRQLRMHGENPRYFHAFVGGNFRIDPIQCAALSVKLPHLDRWNALRRERGARYDAAFADTPVTTPSVAYAREDHIYNQYVITVPERRDEFRAFLAEKEIGHNVYYPLSLHQQECFAYLGYKEGDFPNSEYAAGHSVALPVYAELPEAMQDYVVEQIRAFFA